MKKIKLKLLNSMSLVLIKVNGGNVKSALK